MLSSLSTPARAAVAAVAVVAVLAMGAVAMGGRPQGPAAPSTASPATTPTAPPTAPASAAAIEWLNRAPVAPCFPGDPGTTCIEAGTYSLGDAEWPTTVTFDVPEGWWPYSPSVGIDGVLVGPEVPFASGWGVVLSQVAMVSPDPCDPDAEPIPASEVTTPADFAAIMTAWPGFKATREPVPVELGGASGLRLELVSTIPAADCSAAQGGATATGWWARDHSPFEAYPMLGDEPGRFPGQFTILDVDGELVVIMATDFAQSSPFEESQGMTDPERHAGEHQAELRAILDSIRFGDPDAAP